MATAPTTNPLLKRARKLTRIARLRLLWERYAPVLAIAGVMIAVFMAASFAGIWERIGDPWRGLALIAMIYVTVKAGMAARAVRVPSLSDARRRVERDSGARHRPLDTLSDHPAVSQDLWPVHYEKAREAAAKLGPPLGRPALSLMDPYYLRYITPVVLGLCMMVGAGDNLERLKRSLTPVWQAGIASDDISFEAWVDPPDYTGRPPIYFKDKTAIDIPAGSELVARISGSKNATRLKLTSNRRSRYLPLTRLGPKSFETRAIIDERTTARWRIGALEKRWVLTALPDLPPKIKFEINPRADKRDRLAFTYSFTDDYGVESLSLNMRLLTEDAALASDVETITVPLARQSVREADFAKAALDLTKHHWAGKKVTASLIAKDGLGQTARSIDVYFTVPDKIFIEPLAKAVIEHRSLILAGQTEYAPLPTYTAKDRARLPWFDTYEPEQRLGRAAPDIQKAALLIEAVTDYPQGLFEDPAVFMGLKNVLGRLRYSRELAGLEGIPDDLWRIALRAEFGVLGTALEEMREAERALRDGMARRAPQREIDTLFSRYNEAVERYMEELRRKAMEDGNIAQGGGQDGGEGRNADEIEELRKAIEEAYRIGDTEGARRALAQLAELLENMQIQLAMSPGGGGDGEPLEGEMSEEMKKSLEEMADLLGEQRELKDETEQAEREQGEQGEQDGSGMAGNNSGANPGDEPGEGTLTPGELAEQQEALQRSLEALAENLPESGAAAGTDSREDGDAAGGQLDENGEPLGGGDDPSLDPGEALADAQRAMGESLQALGEGDLEGAARAQAGAIEALRQAGRGLAEQAGANRREGQQAAGGSGSDPLGRTDGERNDDNSQSDIDQRDNASRSRELLEELRRRAAEQDREESEREYLERLLKRF